MVTHAKVCLTTGGQVEFDDDRSMIEVRDLLAKRGGWFKGHGPSFALAIRRSLIEYVIVEIKISE